MINTLVKWRPLGDLRQDIGYAYRTLGKARMFTAVAVLTLALGIGVNAAMFSITNAVLLRPLPFPHAERLVSLWESDLRRQPPAKNGVSWPDVFDWRSRTTTLEQVSGYRDAEFTVSTGSRARNIPGAVVSANFFATLGVQPALGRAFARDEERPGADVVVISDALWRSEFGAAPTVAAGGTLAINGRRFTVVGVVPSGFHFPVTFPKPQIWITAAEDARVEQAGDTPMTSERGARFIRAFGRLRPDVTAAAAQSELDTIAEALAHEHPETNGKRGIGMTPFLDTLVRDTRRPLVLLLSAVGCVLLIACVNLANLLLARGSSRRREMSLRVALGASRFRIMRQLLTENLVLSMAGMGAGLLLAYWTVPVLVRLAPVDVRGLDEATIDGTVFVFTGALAVVSVMLSGFIPGLQAARTDLTAVLQESARSGTGRGQRRLRALLVVAEMAMGVMLLVGAGLLLRGFDRLTSSDPGFQPDHLITAQLRLPDSKYPYVKQLAFYDRVLASLSRSPGMEPAAAMPLPLSGTRYHIGFALPGAAVPRSERPSALFAMISPGYFHTMRIRLIRGREFLSSDNVAAPRVVIVSDAFARQYFPGQDPIGQRIHPGLSTTEPEEPWREIVGVVADVKQDTLTEAVQPTYYVPYAQGLISNLQFVVRSPADPAAVVRALDAAVDEQDSDLVLYNVNTLDHYVANSVATPRFQTVLLSTFAGLALVLAAVGLYGVMSYGVAQRTREFGVRLALGARRGNLVSLVLREGMAIAGIGLLLGALGATFTARLLTSELNGIDPGDPTTFGGVAVVLLLVAIIASCLPALRTIRVDPTIALRSD
jgi:predicted permease